MDIKIEQFIDTMYGATYGDRVQLAIVALLYEIANKDKPVEPQVETTVMSIEEPIEVKEEPVKTVRKKAKKVKKDEGDK